MKNNFTKSLTDAIEYSREEAARLQNKSIGSEHLMLGVLRDGNGEACRILREKNIDLAELKLVIDKKLRNTKETDARISLNYIVLNKGSSSGVKVGMPVISMKGLVGSIIRCSDSYSVVEAINSKNVKIPAILSNSKIDGIVSWNNDEYLYMQYVSNLSKVSVGEEVYTSVLNSKFPENLLIGKVVEVSEDPGTYFHKIIIQPANVFFDYRQLLVVEYIKDEESIKLIEQVENRLLEFNKKKK